MKRDLIDFLVDIWFQKVLFISQENYELAKVWFINFESL